MAGLYTQVWSPATKIAAHTAVRDIVDAADPTPGYIVIYNVSDSALATITLALPSFTINGTTGEMTVNTVATSQASADGTASYASLYDGSDNEMISLPCSQGTSAATGYCVLSDLSLLNGRDIDLVSFSVS